MIRNILLATALGAIFLLGEWTRILRDENQALKTKNSELKADLSKERGDYETLYYNYIREDNLLHHGSDSGEMAAADIRAQLASAKKRLQELTKSLADMKSKADPNQTVQSHISEDSQTINKLQFQLKQLNSDTSTVGQRSKVFRNQQNAHRQSQRADLNARAQAINMQMQQIKADIQALNQNKSDPNRKPRLAELRARSDDLKAQKAAIDQERAALNSDGNNMNQAINQEVSGENDEIHAERDQAMRDLSQAKSDLEYWKRMKNDANGKDKEIKSLQNEIATQKQKVDVLERLVAKFPGST